MRHEWRHANPPSRFVVSEYPLRLLALLRPLLPVLPLPHASNVLTRSDDERSARVKHAARAARHWLRGARAHVHQRWHEPAISHRPSAAQSTTPLCTASALGGPPA